MKKERERKNHVERNVVGVFFLHNSLKASPSKQNENTEKYTVDK